MAPPTLYGHAVSASEIVCGMVFTAIMTGLGTVTLPNRARNKSAGMLGSRRNDDVAPRLHRRGPEGSVRFCGGVLAVPGVNLRMCAGAPTLSKNLNLAKLDFEGPS
jgi:hypothetical protein